MKTQRTLQLSTTIAGQRYLRSNQPSAFSPRFLQVSGFKFAPVEKRSGAMSSDSVPVSSSSAFTLAEMLVSISVLLLLIVLITQLLGSATKVTTGSRNHMDTDAQARLVFDRMATDFGSMLKRKDVDYVFTKTTGNDSLFFYSEAPAYFDQTISAPKRSPISLIGYRINPITFQLERLGKGLLWDGEAAAGTVTPGSVVFLTYPSHDPAVTPTPPPLSASTISKNWPSTDSTSTSFQSNPPDDIDYHVISDQVYRLEFCFLRKNGSYTQPLPAPATFSSADFSGISGIVVTLGILDDNSRKIIKSDPKTNTLNKTIGAQMVSALPDPLDTDLAPITAPSASPSPSKLPAKTWTAAVTASDFATKSGIPQTAAGQVRIYQRTFYLNNSSDL